MRRALLGRRRAEARLSLRAKLVILITLGLLPVGALTWIWGLASIEKSKSQLAHALVDDASALVAKEVLQISGLTVILGNLAAAPAETAEDPVAVGAAGLCRGGLAGLLDLVPYARAAAAFAPDGSMHCQVRRPGTTGAIPPEVGPEVAEAIAAGRPGMALMPAQDDRLPSEVLLWSPVPQAQGSHDAVSASLFIIPPGDLASLGIELDLRFAILDAAGEPLEMLGQRGVGRGWLPGPGRTSRHLTGVPVTLLEDEAFSGVLSVIRPIDGTGNYLVLDVATLYTFETLSLEQLAAAFLPLILWAAALVIVWYAIDRWVLRWVVFLTKLTRLYARGRLGLHAGPMEGAPLELRELGATLTEMAASLRAQRNRLRHAVDQQTVLLKETHHRVKNNLQVMTSLLNMQIDRTESEEAREELIQTRHRLNALSLVHRDLYMAENLEEIPIHDVLHELLAIMVQQAKEDGRKITLRLAMAEAVANPDHAVPLALFVAETANQILLPDGEGQTPLHLSMTLSVVDGARRLEISADRGGLFGGPETSLELRLLKGFARQLRAELSIDEADGTSRVSLRLPPEVLHRSRVPAEPE